MILKKYFRDKGDSLGSINRLRKIIYDLFLGVNIVDFMDSNSFFDYNAHIFFDRKISEKDVRKLVNACNHLPTGVSISSMDPTILTLKASLSIGSEEPKDGWEI